MHDWGEDDFDWEGLNEAINYIDYVLVNYGRINVRQSKEKFGTARIYCSLGWDCFLNITHPRYVHYRPYPNWLKTFDIFYLSRIIPYLNWFVVPYQKWIYKLAYKNAVKKHPHLKAEICCYADYRELLKGLY